MLQALHIQENLNVFGYLNGPQIQDLFH